MIICMVATYTVKTQKVVAASTGKNFDEWGLHYNFDAQNFDELIVGLRKV